MTIERRALPYEKGALEPYISGRTVDLHYGKHHATYEANANKLLAGTELQGEALESILEKTRNDSSRQAIFNNAAQVWNHTFYWHCMKPGGGGKPTGRIAGLIDDAFGGYEQFREEFHARALGQFGSGWAWLVMADQRLSIVTTANADTPVAQGIPTLLTVDVWEHAYYLDYQNRRADYLTAFIDHLVNWDFVNERLAV